MDLGLKDKVALVSGAGSPGGLGAAIVDALAEEGVHIFACDMAPEQDDDAPPSMLAADPIAQGLGEGVAAAKARGVDAISARADLSEPEEVEALVARARNHFGQVDILVNVAGGSWGANRVGEYDVDAWRRTMEVNLYGVFLMTREILPMMEQQGGGAIVNVSAIAALRSHPMASAYGAAQAGVAQFTRDVAAEYGPLGVRANAILAGDIRTGAYLAECTGMASLLGMSAEEVAQMSAETAPLRRLGEPGDVARLAVFLASKASSFLTGLCIPATGGRELPFKQQ